MNKKTIHKVPAFAKFRLPEYRSPGRLSVKEQTHFVKRLSFLIRAGIPLLESLTMLREQTTSRGLKSILDRVIVDVSNGQYLAKSLGNFKNIFGDFAINIIKVGESSGILSQNLEYLAEELRKKQILRRKVVGSLVYPALITCATLGITVFLMTYLFPKIMPVFLGLHMKLPLSTRIVIFLSDSLRTWGIYIFLALAFAVFAIVIFFRKSRTFRYVCHAIVIELPVFGDLACEYAIANTTRTLGLLLQSGINLSDALPITAETTTNLVYKRHLTELGKAATRGEKISVHLRKHAHLFPEIVGQMVAIGERSGNLSHTFIYLSEMYESEVDEFTKNISTLIEPVLMICMGIIVGFMAISIITPIYGITQNLHS